MKPQEIELWARDIIESVLKGQPVEDSRVELKARWIEAEKAAPRLGGHANASRGANILWLIGVDERNSSLTTVDATEKGDWYKSVEKHFDGFAPRLLIDVNFKVDGKTIVALYFETATEAPFVVKSKNSGNYPEYIVPWREGTMLRAARRADLLRLLVPVIRVKALITELKFNSFIEERILSGYLFRENEFLKALQDGLIETLPEKIKTKVMDSYIEIGITNQLISKAKEEEKSGFQPMSNHVLKALERQGLKKMLLVYCKN
ncbi:MAG: hypothetical protein WKF71_11080 [Pyrinomonadaceae bacterium]